MKKYHQLLLFITTTISFSLLLVYRHEYNRLHKVLEVFDFFGQPCNFSDLQFSENVLEHQDWGVEPLWQEHENVYLYSAFWTKRMQAETIVLQVGQANVARNCYLWYENKQKPVIGKFKYSKLAYDSIHDQTVYLYYCKPASYQENPYSVSFTNKNKKLNSLKRILLTVPAKHSKQDINITICISPTVFNKDYFVEFLSYHKLIGIDNFIFYGNSYPHRLQKLLTNLSTRLNIKATFFPWNYPKDEGAITRKIVEKDCITRTSNFSQNTITLEINEFIVPFKHYHFKDVMSGYDSKKLLTRLSLPVQIFCVENIHPNKPLVLQNINVNYDNDSKVEFIYRADYDDNIITTQYIPKTEVSIHKYVECLDKPKHSYEDSTILKFSTDLTRSTLVQLHLYGQI